MITAQPTDDEICEGGTSTLSVAVDNGTGDITYQWQISTDGTNFSDISGATDATYTTDALSATTYYQVVVSASASGCDDVTSAIATVTVIPDIVITADPTDDTICEGGTSSLSVSITGGAGTITYQWQISTDGTNFSDITGATNATYTTDPLTATTYYQVLVEASASGCEAATSAIATITVIDDLAITAQPQDDEICEGGTATVSVTVSGGAGTITYQWQSSTDGTNFSDITGATNATYNTPALTTTTFYQVIIEASASDCDAVTSAVAEVTVVPDLVITAQPTDDEICEGGTSTLSVAVDNGTGDITYQWQISTDGTNFSDISGATDATYTTDALSATTYYQVVVSASASGCDDVTSAIATVTVTPDIVITADPTDDTICEGGTSSLSVSITGGAGTITYQWQISTDGTNFSDISGATNATYTTDPLTATTYYQVLVEASASGCEAATSAIATITVIDDLAITAQPQDDEICEGGTATVSVTVSGGAGTITYQWQSSTDGTNFSDITGATNDTYNTPALTTTTFYQVIIEASASDCDAVTSAVAEVTVVPDLVITAQPQDDEICEGGTSTLSVAVDNGTGDITYQWQISTDGTNFSDISGATNATYTTDALSATTYYQVVVSASASGCDDVTSAIATVTVIPDIVITADPTDDTICEGGTSSLSVSITGGAGTITYQWQISTDGTNFSDITGATNATYTTDPLTATTYYQVLVEASASGCEAATSAIATITVIDDLAITAQPQDDEICEGGTATVSVTVSGGAGTITYQWQSSTDGTNFSDITGATNATYNTPALTETTYYQVIIEASASDCDAVTSAVAEVTVVPDLVITAQPTDDEICVDGTSTLSVAVDNGTGDITYQWQISTDGTNFSDISGATDATYTTDALSATTYYQVVVSASASGCDDVTSAIATVTVIPDIVITADPTDDTICEGGTSSLSVSITGGAGTITYQWQISTDGTNFSDITGATNATYTTDPLTATTYYQVLVEASASGCEAATSAIATITVIDDLAITAQPQDDEICEGGTATVSVTVSGGAGTITYQWQSSTDGTNFSDISGATNDTYDTPALTTTTFYQVIIEASASDCDAVTSAVAEVTVVPDLVITAQPTDDEICEGGTSTLSVAVDNGTGDITYQWQISTDGANFSDISGATNATYTTDALSATTYYQVVVSASASGCDDVTSAIATVTVIPDIVITADPTDDTICEGGTSSLSVSISGGAGTITYQWQISTDGTNFSDITGATNATYTTDPLTATTYYQVLVEASASGCEAATSAIATITVIDDLAITAQPQDDEICEGGTATVSVTVSGGAGTITYQWQSSTDGTNFSDITGATNDTYNTPALITTTFYQVIIEASASDCDAVTSAVAEVTVVPDLVITAQPTDDEICEGGTSTLSVAVDNGTGDITYQWQISTDGTNFSDITGATDATYTTDALSATTYYQVVVSASASGCDDVTSAIATVTVIPDIVITADPTDDTICEGGTSSLSVSITGGAGTITYQWQISTDGTNFSDITGATNATYTTDPLTATTYYQVLVEASASGCEAATSAITTITVIDDLAITAQPQDDEICEGGTATVSVTVSGGAGTITYQWQSSTDGTNFSDISGATDATYNTPALTTTTFYQVIIEASASDCDAVTSAVAEVTVVPDLVITAQPTDDEICEGGTSTLSVAVDNGTGDITYQWQISTDGTNFSDISGATDATYTTDALSATTYYQVVVSASASGCDDVTSAIATVTVIPDIVITADPTDDTICEGGTSSLSVSITGGAGTITYQWQISTDGTNFSDITGATNATYTTDPLTATTYYQVLVEASASGCEAATSAIATITVIDDLAITAQPQDDEICEGGTATVSVTVSGGAGTITYQWQSSTDGTNFSDISGATNDTYDTPALTTTTFYQVIIEASASDCDAVTSAVAEVTVVPDLVITAQPTDDEICEGGTSTLSVAVDNGTGDITYQWQISTDGTNFSDISGATDATYTTDALSATTYYQVVVSASASGCDDVTSAIATVTVIPDIVITADPTDDTICEGGTSSLSVSITGGAGTITYQWQISTDGTNFSDITGATNATYTTDPLTTTTYYQVLVEASASGCEAATSAIATITVIDDLAITAQPQDDEICEGGTATVSVTVSGGAGTITYQWQSSTDGTNFSDITGATDATYNTPALTQTTFYQVIIEASASDCDAVTSAVAEVTVVPDLVITAQPTDDEICEGGTSTLSVAVDNGTGDITYQWQISTDGTNFSDITGATDATYTTDALSATTYYQVVVSASASGCDDVTSAIATVTVIPDIVITADPTDDTICEGGTSSLSVSITGGAGTITYQWQISTDGTNFSDITGATNATYTTDPLTATTYYQVLVEASASGCEAATSAIATITVIDDLAITAQPQDDEICEGGTATVSVTVSGGAGTITYQWQSSTDGTNFSDISGATNATYNTPALTTTTFYQVIIEASASDCDAVTSAVAEVTVVPDLVITAQPQDDEICEGGTSTLSVAVDNGTGDITYQWQISTDGTNFSDISGATNATYTTDALSATTYYQVVVSASASGCDDVTSAIATVTVIPDIVITADPTDDTVCEGGTSSLNVSITGGAGTITYQWQISTDGTNFSDITGATNATYTTDPLTATTYYQVLVEASASGCEAATSAIATITVIDDLAITAQPQDDEICEGGTATVSVTVSGGAGTITYQWQSSTDGTNFSDISGATNDTYDTPALSTTTFYQVIIEASASDCDAVTSAVAEVTVVPDLVITAQPTDDEICEGGTSTLSVAVDNGTGDITYQWQISTDGTNFSDISGATDATYTTDALSATTYYQVVVSASASGCDDVTSAIATVTVIPDIVITADPTDDTICEGGTSSLSVSISGGAGTITYQWQISTDGTNFSDISGATNATYTTDPLTATTYYQVLVEASASGCEAATSAIATITVIDDLAITAQPQDDEICEGGTATVSVTVSGGAGTITYQWQSSTDGTNFSDITGATNDTYNTPALITTTFYQVIIEASASDCDAVTSAVAEVTVVPDLVITAQPTDDEICEGGTSTLSVAVDNGTGDITYQWQISTDGTNFSDITGATDATYTTDALSATTYYQVVVSASASGCDDVTSAIATVTVIPDIVITADPTDDTICEGGTSSLSVSITGGAGTITYQWQISTDGTNFSDITGATNATYTTDPLTATTYYQVLVEASASGCEAATSAITTITVIDDLAITAQPQDDEICEGGTATVSVTVSGGAGTITYQWQSSTDGTNFSDITGATNATYNTPALTITTFYQVIIEASASDCDAVTSAVAEVTVVPDLVITAQPTDDEICEGGTSTLSVAVDNGTGDITYQWQISTDGTNFSDITGATDATYTTDALSATTYYQVVVSASASGCDDLTSAIATVTVIPDIVITADPTDDTICEGGTSSLSVSITGGAGTITYQWQISTDGTNFSDITGATNATYTTDPLTATTYYQVLVEASASGCEAATSAIATITVIDDLAITAQPQDDEICEGGTATVSVTVSGGAGTITYQWQSSTDGTNFSDISGATNDTYDTPALTTTTFYQVIIEASGQ